MKKIVIGLLIIILINIGCVTHKPYSGISFYDISEKYILKMGNPDVIKTYIIDDQHAIDFTWNDIDLCITFINNHNNYDSWKTYDN